jgi:hypothetical protein
MISLFLAQKINIGGEEVSGPIKNISTLGDLINTIMNFLVPLAAVILFIVLLWGGYDYLLSRGSPDKIKGAKAKITAGIIGFVLLLTSYILVRFIGGLVGLGEGTF